QSLAGCIYQFNGEDKRKAGRPRREKPCRRSNKTTGRPSDVSLNQLSSASVPLLSFTHLAPNGDKTLPTCSYTCRTEQRLRCSQKQDGTAVPEMPHRRNEVGSSFN